MQSKRTNSTNPSINKVNEMAEIKVVMLGDVAVGKTSLVQRFTNDNFSKDLQTTIGASFQAKIITVDGVEVKFQIWDTAGQEKYRSLVPIYYKDAHAAIVVFDMTDSKSFASLQYWMDELQKGPANLVKMIASNKQDKIDSYAVDVQAAYDFAKLHKSKINFTSAKTASGVSLLFEDLAKEVIMNRNKVNNPNRRKDSTILDSKKKQKEGCC